MQDENNREQTGRDCSGPRRRIENLAIFVVTLALFLAASKIDLHAKLHQWLGEPTHAEEELFKLRSLAEGTLDAGLKHIHSGWLDVDGMMTFGLFASLGLSVFAFLQAGRLKSALRRQERAEQVSKALALHDPLTGLANRRKFESFGQEVLETPDPSQRRAVFLIDLDHFKPVNDVHGHAAGDLVLRAYAERIVAKFPGGLVARFGGDEFAAITPPLSTDTEALEYAEACLDAVQQPFIYQGESLHIGASVGVSFLHAKEHTLNEALRRADIALYKAKNGGRQQCALYEEGLEDSVLERNWLKNALRQAIADDAIVPHFQPIVDLKSKDIIGYEALARWNHPERGLISPADFIPIAEESGLIVRLGEQMLARAVAIAREWPSNILLSINLSPVQLHDKTLALKIITILETAGFPPGRLEVEITENALVRDLEGARETISHLRAAGISIALDDFGTGHSTLHHLLTCRFDKLKIDQRFVRALGEDHESRVIVDTILALSRQFGIRCTAEGIETASHADMLSDWGCSEGQGYHFGRPADSTAYCQPKTVAVAATAA